jgi:hypothetical protein
MAITATFYKNDKKINSTKLPVAAADDITLSVELKDVTNMFTPSLVISADVFTDGLGHIVNPMRYNYCYLPDFERYFFVRSWSWIVGRWECALEVDVMASFKTEIGNTAAFILRAASQYDADIIDTKYPTKSNEAGSLQEQSLFGNTTPWNTDIKNASITSGFYVISVVNDDISAIGGVSYYALSATVMQELMNKLFASPTWMNITDANISADLQKMLFNPMQYITSVMWIPRGLDTTGLTSTNTLPLGWWSLTLTGGFYRLNVANTAIEFTITCSMKYHPQYDASKRRWLQLSPYTMAALYMPPFGFIPLDMTKLYRCSDIVVRVRIDVITGRGTLFISNKYQIGGVTYDGGVIYTTVTQVGVPMSIAQMSVSWDMLTSASTWAAAAGVSLAVGGLQEGLKNMANGLIDGAKDILSEAKSRLTTRPAMNPNIPQNRAKMLGQFAGNVGSGIIDVATTAISAGISGEAGSKESSLLSSLKQIAGDIGSTALAAAGTCTSSGSTGGFACLQEKPFVQFYFMMIAGVDDTHNGIPLCRSTLIKNLSGFILCGNTDDFTANCTPAERQAVRGIMEAGFYYE